jgi:hypothetical protein
MSVRQYYSRRTPIGEMLKLARDENKLSQRQVIDRLLEDYEMNVGVQVLRDLEYLGPRNEDHLKLVEALDEIYGSNIVDEIEEY